MGAQAATVEASKLSAPASLTPGASAMLDATRALSALAVMIDHARGLFFDEYSHVRPELLSLPVKAIYFFSGFGLRAVMVFYVLSGYFISGSILRDMERGRWSWKEYAISRSVRLYLVLIPALLLTLLWDGIGITHFDMAGRYSGPVLDMGYHNFREFFTAPAFFSTLFFLGPTFGSDGLWSLYCEFWFYVLFPALVCAWLAVREKRVAAAAGFLALALVCKWRLGGWWDSFAIWLWGVGVVLCSKRLRIPDGKQWLLWLYSLAAAGAFGFILYRARVGRAIPGTDYVEGLAFAFLMLGILKLRLPDGARWTAMAKGAAGFSYTLYLAHAPVLLLLHAMIGGSATHRWQPDLQHLLIWLAICAGMLLYSYALAQMTEKHTPRVRAWVRGLIPQRA